MFQKKRVWRVAAARDKTQWMWVHDFQGCQNQVCRMWNIWLTPTCYLSLNLHRKDPLSLVLWNPIPVHPRWLTLPSGQFCQPHQYTGSIWEKETFPHREAYLSLLRTGRIWYILVLGEFLYAFDFIVSITPSKWPLVTWTTRVTQASLCFHYLLQQVIS